MWAFYPVSLILFPFLYQYSVDDCRFVVCSEISKPYSSSSILLSQDCFGYTASFAFPYKLKKNCSSSVKNAVCNFMEVASNLQIALGSMVVLTTLILPLQELYVSFHLFVLSLVSFISISQFLEYRSFASLGRYS